MKPRVLLLAALLTGGPGALSAQTLQYGLSGGLLASTYQGLHLPNGSEVQARLGAAGGAWARHALGRHLALQAELRYEARGAGSRTEGLLGWEGSMGYFVHEEKSRLHYLTLPVLLRVRVGKFFAEAGPQLSYLAAARNELHSVHYVRSPSGTPLSYTTTEHAGAYRRWEPGLVVGLGYELTPRLELGVRYGGAFSRLHRPQPLIWPDYGPYVLNQTRNATLQLQLSYCLAGS
jgi:hypothetical protein